MALKFVFIRGWIYRYVCLTFDFVLANALVCRTGVLAYAFLDLYTCKLCVCLLRVGLTLRFGV